MSGFKKILSLGIGFAFSLGLSNSFANNSVDIVFQNNSGQDLYLMAFCQSLDNRSGMSGLITPIPGIDTPPISINMPTILSSGKNAIYQAELGDGCMVGYGSDSRDLADTASALALDGAIFTGALSSSVSPRISVKCTLLEQLSPLSPCDPTQPIEVIFSAS